MRVILLLACIRIVCLGGIAKLIDLWLLDILIWLSELIELLLILVRLLELRILAILIWLWELTELIICWLRRVLLRRYVLLLWIEWLWGLLIKIWLLDRSLSRSYLLHWLLNRDLLLNLGLLYVLWLVEGKRLLWWIISDLNRCRWCFEDVDNISSTCLATCAYSARLINNWFDFFLFLLPRFGKFACYFFKRFLSLNNDLRLLLFFFLVIC